MDDEKKALVDKFYSLDTNALDNDGHHAPEFVMRTQPEIGKLVDPSTDDEGATKKAFWANMPKVGRGVPWCCYPSVVANDGGSRAQSLTEVGCFALCSASML